MKLKFKEKLESKGYYSLSVFKEDGTEVVEKAVNKTCNVVTYNGAYTILFEKRIGINLSAVVGTGTTELTRSSTGLSNETETSSSNVESDRSTEVTNGDGTATSTITRTLEFNLGQVVGTISEVGLKYTYYTGFIAGQLIKDEFGDPTTITLLEDEQLIVTYTLEFTFPDASASVQPIVGSGSVTVPTGTSTYNIYSQPYYCEYIDLDSTLSRVSSSKRMYVMNNSSGNVITVIGDNTAPITSHDGAGNVTINFTEQLAAPSDFNSTDIKFISIGAEDYRSTFSGLDPTSKRAVNDTFGGYGTTVAIAEFSPALTKTSSDSMTVHFTAAFTV